MTPEQMREYFQNLTPEQREAMRQQRGAGGQGFGQGRPGGTGQGTQGTGQGMPAGARSDTTARVVTRQQ